MCPTMGKLWLTAWYLLKKISRMAMIKRTIIIQAHQGMLERKFRIESIYIFLIKVFNLYRIRKFAFRSFFIFLKEKTMVLEIFFFKSGFSFMNKSGLFYFLLNYFFLFIINVKSFYI